MTQTFDLCAYSLLHHDSLQDVVAHHRSLELFRDSVVRPSLKTLSAEIEKLSCSEEVGAEFMESDLADIFRSSVEGYLLTVQAMWERGLRALLIAREKKLCGGEKVEVLERAPWLAKKGPDLHAHFERLMGFKVDAFDSYADLQLLQNLGNAIRHGEGASARIVHNLAPNLWWGWIPPGETHKAGPFEFTAPEGPAHPSFSKVTLTEKLLEQMILSVLWFWEDLDNLRCQSFKRKATSVAQRLALWSSVRASRAQQRMWSPESKLA